jgi:hypothetical protein
MSLWLDELTDLAPRLVAENSLHHIAFVGVGTGILWGLSRSILQGATNTDCVVMLKQTVCVCGDYGLETLLTQYDFKCLFAIRNVRWRSPTCDVQVRQGDCADSAPRSTVLCSDLSMITDPSGAKSSH